MSRPDFPRTIVEFQRHFPDDQACTEYLFASRWPEGFVCSRCGNELAWPVAKRRLVWECAACHRQRSVTAGTVLHKTHTPLHLWFWAAYLMSNPDARRLGAAVAAPARPQPVRDCVDDAA